MFATEKVLIGCDGVNSVVARWLGFKEASFAGRSAIRGCAEFKSSHGFEPKFMQFFGKGLRAGAIPCDDKTVYWFFTWTLTSQGEFFVSDQSWSQLLLLYNVFPIIPPKK